PQRHAGRGFRVRAMPVIGAGREQRRTAAGDLQAQIVHAAAIAALQASHRVAGVAALVRPLPLLGIELVQILTSLAGVRGQRLHPGLGVAQRGALAHRALGPVTRGIAIRRGHGWRSSPRQAKAQQHAGETGTHVQRSFAGKKPYCTLIASGSRPPRSSLPLASASSDAVPYGPMRTRYTVRPLTWADSTRAPRPSRAIRALSASASPEALNEPACSR